MRIQNATMVLAGGKVYVQGRVQVRNGSARIRTSPIYKVENDCICTESLSVYSVDPEIAEQVRFHLKKQEV